MSGGNVDRGVRSGSRTPGVVRRRAALRGRRAARERTALVAAQMFAQPGHAVLVQANTGPAAVLRLIRSPLA